MMVKNYRPLIRKQAAKLSRYRTDYAHLIGCACKYGRGTEAG
jgi:hypothetical protein